MFWAPWVSSTDILQCLVRPWPAVLTKPLGSHSQGCGSFLLRGAVFSSSPSPIPATCPSPVRSSKSEQPCPASLGVGQVGCALPWPHWCCGASGFMGSVCPFTPRRPWVGVPSPTSSGPCQPQLRAGLSLCFLKEWVSPERPCDYPVEAPLIA